MLCSLAAAAADEPACATPGRWLDPVSGEPIALDQLMASLAERQIVLLGEIHEKPEHHRWQTHVLAALQAHRPALVVGFEMFPRSVQPALDGWWRGALSEAAFLEQSRWERVWGMDPALYWPLFHFVRQNRVPMVALNVERRLVARVAREGWAAVPESEREDLSAPAAAPDAYRRSLARIFWEQHDGEPRTGPLDIEAVLQRDDFARFVEAQLTWDRAMAEALAEARWEHPEALVVGIIGSGHLRFGHGVPHQLADLGLTDVAVLLPLEAGAACDTLPSDIADAVFLLEPADSGR
ncbi:MAG: ChaN family lipoprotein [Kiloniellales bacterium]